ncbi:uncharacterized protein LOC141596291 [Silene latifolia]|uniref:uncharacterized protein LOC141596291 n=1 Tax=Silene latifolia TaxID=37657 RepID=UPI003D7795F3
MTGERVCSSPDLLPLSFKNHEDVSLEGIATNVKLLLKLVQDHQNISVKGAFDDRKTQRFAGMMTILDDVKTRLQKSQASGNKKKPELRRCNTDLRIHNPPRDVKKDDGLILDDKERLKRDLNTSLLSQKRLGAMCASLGREKEIIVRELTRKVQEVNEMEQLINDLKAQNERLSTKLQACATHKTENNNTSESVEELNVMVLRERNKELCDQLLKCLEGYRLMKRRLKETQEETEEMKATMEELGDEIQIGIEKISNCVGGEGKIEENIVSIYHVFKKVEERVSKYRKEGRQ